MFKRTVLVVDDEPIIRMVLADALEDNGFTVIEASNVLEAIAVLGKHRIDCLVTDVDMPGGLNGFDLVRFVRRFDAQMVVVVTSGRKPHDGELSVSEQFIAKPYRVDVVVNSLNTVSSKVQQFTMAG